MSLPSFWLAFNAFPGTSMDASRARKCRWNPSCGSCIHAVILFCLLGYIQLLSSYFFSIQTLADKFDHYSSFLFCNTSSISFHFQHIFAIPQSSTPLLCSNISRPEPHAAAPTLSLVLRSMPTECSAVVHAGHLDLALVAQRLRNIWGNSECSSTHWYLR